MNENLNEFKFAITRQFGSEQISFTAIVKSDKVALSDEDVKANIHQMDVLVREAFLNVQEREIFEKEELTKGSEKRTATVKALDQALKDEMAAGTAAGQTMKSAERLSNKLQKQNKG